MRVLPYMALVLVASCTAKSHEVPQEDAGPDGLFQPADGGDAAFVDDAACASVKQVVDPTPLPVDIIWMIDNSASMAPAVAAVNAGMNAFANLVDAKSLDYRVIVLSLRSATSPIQVGGSTRYPICIPQPLAGDDACGNGPRFYQSSIDIRSTQTFEQFLGTLGQTSGYTQGQALGGEAWKAWLRPEATKTILVVTDDNARLTAQEFETYTGGQNPFNSNSLPPGMLDVSWNGLFNTDYIFGGVYGWGDPKNPSVRCTYADSSLPPSGGSTYSMLVAKTGGPRAKICDGASAWTPFFDAVTTAVLAGSKIDCTMSIPDPGQGQTLDPHEVNVTLEDGTSTTTLTKTDGKGTCGSDLSWYYDDDTAPTKVILCPAACQTAQAMVGAGKTGSVNVLLGCATIVK